MDGQAAVNDFSVATGASSMAPHLRLLLLFSILILSVFLMLPKSAPSSYRSSELEKVVIGDTTEYRLNGKLTYGSDINYARAVKTTSGNEVLECYYDELGNPAKQGSGHYAVLRVYEGKNEVSKTYLDQNHQPTTNTSGYTTEVRVFENGHRVEEWYKDIDGAPVANKSGVYGRLNVWENGRNTKITYVDADRNPLNHKSGYAIMKRTFYEEAPWKGKVKEEFYFDAAGAPASLTNGQYGIHNEYDEKGRTIRIDYLNMDGTVLSSVVRTFYPDNSIETERYYDANGEPKRQAAGNYGIKKADGKTIYLDESGNEYLSLNKYLHEKTLVVILVGALILLVSSVSSRKVNVILAFLYIGFIAYMTLWNRDGETRAKFELFWSYKQFFTSPSLRLEIMYNIWLFIPLGGILARIGLGWKSVAVCILLSFAIEILQYFTGLGLAEFDDVISNGLGGAIGLIALMPKKAS